MNKTVTILLVDDDRADVKAVRRAFQKQKIANPIRLAKDGLQALEILRGENGEEKLETPYIILLDLSMPRMNGIEFLQELRSDKQLKRSIVFVLTTSDHDTDRVAAYDQNVAGYVVKSRVGLDFIDLLIMLDSYWRVIEMPPHPESAS